MGGELPISLVLRGSHSFEDCPDSLACILESVACVLRALMILAAVILTVITLF